MLGTVQAASHNLYIEMTSCAVVHVSGRPIIVLVHCRLVGASKVQKNIWKVCSNSIDMRGMCGFETTVCEVSLRAEWVPCDVCVWSSLDAGNESVYARASTTCRPSN